MCSSRCINHSLGIHKGNIQAYSIHASAHEWVSDSVEETTMMSKLVSHIFLSIPAVNFEKYVDFINDLSAPQPSPFYGTRELCNHPLKSAYDQLNLFTNFNQPILLWNLARYISGHPRSPYPCSLSRPVAPLLTRSPPTSALNDVR